MSNTIYSDKIKVNCPLAHDENGYYHLIYQVTNKKNGKIYVGKHSTKDPYDSYLGSGKAIKQAIEKYKRENFTKVLLFCFTNENDAFLKEEEIVTQEFVDRDDTYNITTGGHGFGSDEANPMHNIEIRAKVSKSLKGKMTGEKNPFYGKHHTKETKEKLSKSAKERCGEKSPFYGKQHTQSAKNKISKAKRGKYTGENNPFYGKHHTQKTRDKMSKNHADYSGENNPRAKAILKLDNSGNIVAEYSCKKDCREQEHISVYMMDKLIKEHIQHNGFYFVIKPKN